MLKAKKIILGITGSIAAYKAAYLLRLLKKEGADVQVLITSAGKEFITPVTLSALSNRPVLGDFFQTKDGTWNSHVDLGLWADLMLIAPASANTIGKMVAGICDNLLLTTYLSAKCPVMIAPAMDLDMYEHPATQANLKKLAELGCMVIEPGTGELASGLFGKGRMEEPEAIVSKLRAFFDKQSDHSFVGKKVLVSAGPTYERIDPVRFIGNFSSGKMGFSIAEELAKRGAEVYLVSGPVSLRPLHPAIHITRVTSASEMFEVCHELFPLMTAAVMTAAVADYTPETFSAGKLKREKDELVIKLRSTRDIAKALGEIKKEGQVLVGFALESEGFVENAKSKLLSKNLDLIVVNSAVQPGAGFMSDTNQVTIIDRNNNIREYPLKSKGEVATDIADELVGLFH